jgi:acyl carrier protein
MLSDAQIKDKLSIFIKDYFIKDSGIIIKDETSFLDEGILDSTGVLELVAYLESTFEIKIEDEEIIPDNLDSLNKLVDFMRVKLQVPDRTRA